MSVREILMRMAGFQPVAKLNGRSAGAVFADLIRSHDAHADRIDGLAEETTKLHKDMAAMHERIDRLAAEWRKL